MRNKKIISLVCVLAMIFSMFSAFTVVNAEGTKGIKLEGSLSKDLTEVTIVATVQGAAGALKNAAVSFAVPDGVEEDDITFEVKDAFSYKKGGIDNGIYTLGLADFSGEGITPKAELATIKIKFNAPLADNFKITLGDKAGFEDTEGAVSVANGMTATALTVNNPNVKPDKEDRPAENTDEDPVPDKPTPIQPGDSEKGIKVEASLDKTNTTLTLKATVQGAVGALKNAAVSFAVPDGVGEEDITFDVKDAFSYKKGGVDNGIYTLGLADFSGEGITPKAELATITIKLPAPATEAVAIVLGDKAGFEDTEGAVSVANGMTATTVVAEPAGLKPTGTTVALKSYVAKEGPAAATAAKEAGKTVYMTIDITDKDGNAATYGADYIAQYDGKDLTKKEYENLIHGYTDADMADVINNLKFVVYNSTNANKIKTTLNTVEDAKQLVDPTEATLNGKPETAKNATLNATPSKSSVTAGDGTKVKVTTKITNAYEDGVLTVKTDADSLDLVTGSGIKIIAADAENGEYEAVTTTAKEINVTDTIEFVGAAKGNINLYYEYAYTNNLGEERTEKKTVTVKVNAPKGDGGSSSDSSTGSNGPIASGSKPGNNQSGTINFVDLDTVTWAQDAILRLVDKKVVNGRSNTIFDPNGTVTRAEFAKMVVLGFGLTGGAPGNFSDVDTSAWYNNFVQIGYANDVISGYDDGTFRPNGLISRQEMAAMISRAVKAANKNLPAVVEKADFTDVSPATEWGYAEISALQTAGVINGMTATTFEPYSNATRAQAAVIIDRAMTNAK